MGKAKPKSISLKWPTEIECESFFFNRFCIQKYEKDRLLHFGFISNSGELMSSHAVYMPCRDFLINRGNTLSYIEKFADSLIKKPPQLPAWDPPAQTLTFKLVTVMRCGVTGIGDSLGKSCEILFANFSSVVLGDYDLLSAKNGEDASIPIKPTMYLRSSYENHFLLLIKLFVES